VCSPLREIAARLDDPGTELTGPATRPRPGGHPAEAFCPLKSVVTGFRSMSGGYKDHWWIVRSELHGDREHDR